MAMDRYTGKEISGSDEIEQSVDMILGCIPGDRVMRGDYGSELFELTDVGMDASGKARFAQATSQAIRKFEKRIALTAVRHEGDPGELSVVIYGKTKTGNQQISFRRPAT